MKFYLYFEILSFLISAVLYYKKRNKLLLYFIPFLFLTVVIELVGSGLFFNSWFPNYRYATYNVFTTIEFVFYSAVFFSQFRKAFFKKVVTFFIPIFTFLVILNLGFIQGLNKTFHTYTFLLGSFFIVAFCCCFFYESVLPERIDEQLSKQPFFWISSGLLIYYLGSVIINALFDYLTTNDMRIEGTRIYGIINDCLNVILYTSFSISFFLCPDNKKTSSLPS